MLYDSLQPTQNYHCTDTIEVKSKYERSYICGHFEEGTLEFSNVTSGQVSAKKIEFLRVTSHSIQEVDPPALLHIGLALCQDDRATVQYFNILKYGFEHQSNGQYVLNTDVNFESYYSVPTKEARDPQRYTYLYFEAQLNALEVEHYRPYVPYNDNIAIFDSGLSYIEFYTDRYNSFEENFVETYCDPYVGTYRCECEGKNYGLLPNVGLTMADRTYYMGPTDYTFDAYNDHNTYQTWCEVGIRVNYFETTRKEHFNLIGTLFFINYNVSYAVTDASSYQVSVGLQGGSRYQPLETIIESSIIYSIVVVALFVLVILLSLRRHRRLQFEAALLRYNPDKYIENMMRIHQGTKKHEVRLQANKYNVEQDDDLLSPDLEMNIDKVDKRLIEKLENDEQFRAAIREEARRAKSFMPRDQRAQADPRQASAMSQWV